jgi:hypothetical protein
MKFYLIKIKSAKWDRLGDKIGRYYESEDEITEEEDGTVCKYWRKLLVLTDIFSHYKPS